ncbi:VWA domain-containing protein [Planctomycetota bacterium]|nr:VWA domain-containing protein [Planctomycetota bacterium]
MSILLVGLVFGQTQKRVIPINAADAESIEITIEVKPTPPSKDRPNMQLAILLDTSNSMDGLINQAKSQLWTIINQCSKASYNGQVPNLTIAVFEYGNDRLPATEGYIRQVLPFTNDLDAVSKELFSLTTNGGEEYCGTVIEKAIKRLDWSDNPNDYKAIYIAGNEPFTQGQFSYKEACSLARSNNIIVNTIHCGAYDTGIQGMWQHGASLASGQYLNINQDRKVVHIATPYDDDLTRLGSEINETYVWYGTAREQNHYRQNQIAQDRNAGMMGGMARLSRSSAKASKSYRNTKNDLVDAIEEEGVKKLGEVKSEELPKAMQGMDQDEQVKFVKEQKAKRESIRNEIANLETKRQAFLAKKRKDQAKDTLGDAITITIIDQLKINGFKIEVPVEVNNDKDKQEQASE